MTDIRTVTVHYVEEHEKSLTMQVDYDEVMAWKVDSDGTGGPITERDLDEFVECHRDPKLNWDWLAPRERTVVDQRLLRVQT